MRILLLAPQPFYTERGTPIAVFNLAKVLGEAGHQIDLMTFPGGEDVGLKNTQIIRVGKWIPLLGELPVGFSLRKLLLDGVMFFSALHHTLIQDYDVIHAVEESVFIALVCARIRGSRVIYDMDSSMADQLIERRAWLSSLRGVLDAGEGFAIRHASHVLAVCQALADKAQKSARKVAGKGRINTPVTVIEDISNNPIGDDTESEKVEDIRQVLPEYPVKMLYVGNLEPYQGVGCVIDAMAEPGLPDEVGFLVIGGNPQDIAAHQQQAEHLGVAGRVVFLGPRPVKHLAQFLVQADILVSPRTQGINTPMKIYTYLGAGKPVIATDIFSHTQVLNECSACLVAPDGASIAAGITRVVEDKDYAQQIAAQAKEDADNRFSFSRFRERLLALYDTL